MITNRQILEIILQKEEYEKILKRLRAVGDVCGWFHDNAVASIYNQVMQEYQQWLDSEVK